MVDARLGDLKATEVGTLAGLLRVIASRLPPLPGETELKTHLKHLEHISKSMQYEFDAPRELKNTSYTLNW